MKPLYVIIEYPTWMTGVKGGLGQVRVDAPKNISERVFNKQIKKLMRRLSVKGKVKGRKAEIIERSWIE